MLQVIEENGKIYSHIRKKWLIKTPEEVVRQNYLCVLVNHYKYSLEQIKEEENVTGRGSAQARADFVIYKTIEDLQKNNNPLIVVECKAEHINITEKEFIQGELYARIYNTPFFVTHNGKETKFWRVKKDKSPGYREEIENIPLATATQKEIEALYAKLKVFREKEFKQALEHCHNIIRNNEKLDAAAAFDEIAKILFMKVYAERHLRKNQENVFSLEWVEEAERYNPDYLGYIFDKTKTEFGKSIIFKKDERIALNTETIKSIIQRFEKYNLSETSVDTKGIAFENFLGTTFRGDLGQFFTPRPVVDFMIDMLEPQEGQTVCDPACGSGGFLIRFFQKVRETILGNIHIAYQQDKKNIEDDVNLSATQKTGKILQLFEKLEHDIDILKSHTRLWNLANQCIFGTDANERMARIAKMNMIMHGDGHGGIHHHDGLLDVADVKEDNFQIILSNPPFGMKETKKDILKKFEIADFGNKDSVTTQILFIERCINLLKEQGKMAILLPNSIFNAPENKKIRTFVENRGYLLATVMLPRETFLSSNADINCSLLFFKKFTQAEKHIWTNTLLKCKQAIFDEQETERNELNKILQTKLLSKDFATKQAYQTAQQTLKEHKKEATERLKELDMILEEESRFHAKEQFDYPIFMYQADAVGISATGEITDKNNLPDAWSDYQNFLKGKDMQDAKSISVSFKELERWDAKSYLHKLNSNYPIVRLKDYIYEHSEKIKIADFPQDDFSILGVTNTEGVYLNFVEKGTHFNQPYKKVKAYEITYNPYRINIGSVGIVPQDFDGFFISPAYVVFGVREDKETELIPAYLYLVMSSNWFGDFIRAATSGSVRENLSFFELCHIKIPLPPIEKQKKLVQEWQILQEQKKQVQEKTDTFASQLRNDLMK